MMVENDLVEISIRDGEEEVNLRRPSGQAGAPVVAMPAANGTAQSPTAFEQPLVIEEEKPATKDLVTINSPMVGTFYISPEPDAPAYVKVGSRVDPESPVCIVEAMKVFNEIKAEVAGVIERILVKNESAVEYGQPLFEVKPA